VAQDGVQVLGSHGLVLAALGGGLAVHVALTWWFWGRLQSLGMIGGALASWAQGEPCLEALQIQAEGSSTAQWWNKLVLTLDEATAQDRAALAAQKIAAVAGSGAESLGTLDALHHGILVVDAW